MRRIVEFSIFLFMTFVVLLSSSCEVESGKMYEDTNKILQNTDETIQQICNFEGKYDDLLYKYPNAYIIESTDSYSVIYFGKTKAVWLIYDLDYKLISGDESFLPKKSFALNCNKSYFEQINIGDSLADIKKSDPDADYTQCDLAGKIGMQITSRSVHLTTDGYICIVSYEDGAYVSDVSIESINHYAVGNRN